MMTTQEVAQRLYELCEKGDSATAHNELYAGHATSTESNMQGQRETDSGLDAIKAKSKKFMDAVEEWHGGYTNPPVVFGKYIFMEMGLDATMRGMGRITMKEMAKYEVNNGKVVSEEFFY